VDFQVISEALGILEYPPLAFVMRADGRMVVLDMCLEKRPFSE
jgi:hypothetical protein